jgi:hypothetical protein
MATTDEKKQKETKRQNVLLKHATTMILNETMTLSHKQIIYENVLELLEVTKINKALAVKYLNEAMRQGQDTATAVTFINYKKLTHYVTEKCIHCEKKSKIDNGLDNLYEAESFNCIDESGVSCFMDYQNLSYSIGNDKHNAKTYGRIKHVGYCVNCLPKNVFRQINKDQDVAKVFEDYADVELWDNETETWKPVEG